MSNDIENAKALPGVVGVQATQVHYDPPRRHFAGRDMVLVREAIELLVQTTFSLPNVGVTPVIYIGDVPVSKYEPAGSNLYRFFLFDTKRVSVGAPIFIGWPYAPTAKVPTDFRFQPNNGALIV
jgi:hypothetical protein